MGTATNLKNLLADHTMAAAPELCESLENGAVRCKACGHRCYIRPSKPGICKVRFNREGELRVPSGYVAGLQVDPIEKKPLFHAFPGRDALSFGMLGCDLHCSYCQNWVTSQALRDPEAVAMPRFCSADELVSHARIQRVPVVVSTYNEPLITADWAVDVFRRAKAEGLVCGFVSNGNATPEVLEYIRPYVDLYKVDLKGFSDKGYRELGCTLQNVLDSIVRIKQMGFWIEIVTLVIPGFNDGREELRDLTQFIADVSPEIPWHCTAFHPDYHMTEAPRTQIAQLDMAYELAKEAGLHYIYPGNLPGLVGDRESTFCPSCDATLIQRHGFRVLQNRMNGNHCPDCQTQIPGVWEANAPSTTAGHGTPTAIRI